MAFEMMPRFTLPGEEIAKAPTEVQNIMASILAGKQNQQKLQQEALANEQLNKYRMGELGVSQQSQHDSHLKALQERELYNQFFGNKGQQSQNQSVPYGSITTPNQNADNLGRKDLVNIANKDQATYDQSHGVNAPQQNQNSSFSDKQKQLSSGQEVVMQGPRNPNLEMWDKAAGMKFGNVQIPDIKSNIVDGIKYDTYPSGKIVAQKVGPSAEEKAQISLKAAEDKEQAKSDIKEKKESRAFLKNLVEYAESNKSVVDILDRSHEATGVFPWSKKYFKMGSKDIGALNRLIVPMIGTLGHQLGQKGGVGVLGFAQGGKYDTSQPSEYNMGIKESQNDEIIRQYKHAADDYREKFKEEPPYKLPKYYDDWEEKRNKEKGMITIIDHNGEEHEIHNTRLGEARKIDPKLKVKESK